MRKRFTDEKKMEILAHANKTSVAQAAKKYGGSVQAIYKWQKEPHLSIEPKSTTKVISDDAWPFAWLPKGKPEITVKVGDIEISGPKDKVLEIVKQL